MTELNATQNTTPFATQFDQACNAALADMTEHERHYANMFWSVYAAAGLDKFESKRLALTEVYRARIIDGAPPDSLARARRWQQALIVAFPDGKSDRPVDWSKTQRYGRPKEFAEQLADCSESDMAEFNAAIDAVGLAFDGCVVMEAQRITPEIEAEHDRLANAFSYVAGRVVRRDGVRGVEASTDTNKKRKSQQCKRPNQHKQPKPANSQKRKTRKSVQTELIDLTVPAEDLFD